MVKSPLIDRGDRSVGGHKEFCGLIYELTGTMILETAAERLGRRLWLDYCKDPQNRVPPFKPEGIAKLRKVLEIRREDLEGAGRLVPILGGFRIELRRFDRRERQNFTCAHEIGHTYFYDLNQREPRRRIEPDSVAWRFEELFCDYFAEALLMPAEMVRSYFLQVPRRIGYGDLESAAKYFRTTIKSMVRRSCKLNLFGDSNSVLVLIEEKGEKFAGKDRRLRITAWAGPKKLVGFGRDAPVETAELRYIHEFWGLGHRQISPSIRETVGVSVLGEKRKWLDCVGRYRSYGSGEAKYLVGLFAIRDIRSGRGPLTSARG